MEANGRPDEARARVKVGVRVRVRASECKERRPGISDEKNGRVVPDRPNELVTPWYIGKQVDTW